MNRNVIPAVVKKLDIICLTPNNRLILILCCWLLKKTLVIRTNLTNPESAPDGYSIPSPENNTCSAMRTLEITEDNANETLFKKQLPDVFYKKTALI